MQGTQRAGGNIGSGIIQIQTLAVGQLPSGRARQLQRGQTARSITGQFLTLHDPHASGLPDLRDIDQPAACQHVEMKEQLVQAGEQRIGHSLMSGISKLCRGRVPHHLIAILDQVVKQLCQAHGWPAPMPWPPNC